MQGRGHAGDVADADGGRQRRGQGLEVAEVAVVAGIVVLAADDVEAVLELAQLDEAQGRRS